MKTRLLRSSVFLLFIFCAVLSGCLSQSHTDRIKAKVIEVIDGDTIKVSIGNNLETVRFLLVDTPEIHNPRTGVQPFGPEAAEMTKRMLDGKTVELEKDIGDARDKYGRLLMYVYVDGKSVQETLLAKGLARVAYIFPPNVKYVDAYRKIESEAQLAGVGIWSVENYAGEDGFHPNAFNESRKTQQASASNQPEKHQDKGPNGETIKGNINRKGEKIYHVPGGAYYKQTVPEAWFFTEEEAVKAGYRKSSR
jgi:micrococcal nuclease